MSVAKGGTATVVPRSLGRYAQGRSRATAQRVSGPRGISAGTAGWDECQVPGISPLFVVFLSSLCPLPRFSASSGRVVVVRFVDLEEDLERHGVSRAREAHPTVTPS